MRGSGTQSRREGQEARRWVILLLLVGIWGLVWVWRGVEKKKVGEEVPRGPVVKPVMGPARVRAGDAILKGYGKASGTVQGDLTAMAEVVGNFALLVKGDDPLPLGANEELVAALRGKNAAGLVFVSGESAALNGKGQLVDRWGTPLFLHARARDELDIRSAGPDRAMWTEDDVHRLYDGRYLRGEALNAGSLYEASEGAR